MPLNQTNWYIYFGYFLEMQLKKLVVEDGKNKLINMADKD